MHAIHRLALLALASLTLLATLVPAKAHAAEGYLACHAHQSDRNRVLWTRPFPASERASSDAGAAFLTMLKDKGYVQDMAAVAGSCVWKSDQASADAEIENFKRAFANSTDMGVSFEYSNAGAPAPQTGSTPTRAPSSRGPEKAAAMLARCQGGSGPACVNYGNALERGQYGLPRNPSQASAFYEQACTAGNGVGCANLAVLYRAGRGVAANPEVARRFNEKACHARSAMGCYNLGTALAQGRGGSVDATEAVDSYRKACDLGSAKGCYRLGSHLENGVGISPDLAAAAGFYSKACELGLQNGCKSRDRLAKS